MPRADFSVGGSGPSTIERLDEATPDPDILTTFCYLLGLHVDHLATPHPWLRTAVGTADGERVLVLHRTLTGVLEHDNARLDRWFEAHAPPALDRVYVNGSSNIGRFREDVTIHLLEEALKRLMSS